ncbi:UvrD-helicase domain-containing protein, partial [Frankia sp. CiP1_Cm_nod1]
MSSRFLADLHIHSKYSRACSRDCDLEHLAWWAARKGIQVIGTGDFTHPAWTQEIVTKLVPAEPGLFRLRPDLEADVLRALPASCRVATRFMLSTEISTIYKRGERTRKVHHLLYAPSTDAAARITTSLAKIGNLTADGRPILGLDSRDLLEITLGAGDGCYLIPAHVWTPWFAVLGSKSGFDAVEDCYVDLADHIFALETGLSADPPMFWRLSGLDRFRLVSNSDAHSPPMLGREATAFTCDVDYFAMLAALRTGDGFAGTIEFFPEEGKYHLDGHRKCNVRYEPSQTRQADGRCPQCGRALTVGVLHRVDTLADRAEGVRPPTAGEVRSLVALPEVVGEILGVGPKSKAVAAQVTALATRLGPELGILAEVPLDAIAEVGSSALVEAIRRLRNEEVIREAGYDGEYGVIRLFRPEELSSDAGTLFDLAAGTAAPPADAAASSAGVTAPPAGTTVPGATATAPGRAEPGRAEPGGTAEKAAGERAAGEKAAAAGGSRARSARRAGRAVRTALAPSVPAPAGRPASLSAAPSAVGSTAVDSTVDSSGTPDPACPAPRLRVPAADTPPSGPPAAGPPSFDAPAAGSVTGVPLQSAPLPSAPPEMPGSSVLAALDAEQRAAAAVTNGPLLIVAGPGTGKTRTLVHAIAYRVRECAVPAERCLAVTFTRRAAAELRERLDALIPQQASRVFATTFHGLGLRMVQEQHARLGLGPGVTVADEAVRAQVLREALAGTASGARNLERLRRALAGLRRARALGEPTDGHELAVLAREYDRGLRARNLVDLDDLVQLPVLAMREHPEVADEYRARWQHVWVDEYQDVDELQYVLLTMLAGRFRDASPARSARSVPWQAASPEAPEAPEPSEAPGASEPSEDVAGGDSAADGATGAWPAANLCAIGDPDQAIYSFRGSDVGFFLRFRDDFRDAEVVSLTRNYRSTPMIVDAAVRLIEPATLVPGRTLRAVGHHPRSAPVLLRRTADEADEASVVVGLIDEALGGTSFHALDTGVDGTEQARLSFSDIAVLYRTARQARPVMDALDRQGFPFQRRSHNRFADTPGVAYLLELIGDDTPAGGIPAPSPLPAGTAIPAGTAPAGPPVGPTPTGPLVGAVPARGRGVLARLRTAAQTALE